MAVLYLIGAVIAGLQLIYLFVAMLPQVRQLAGESRHWDSAVGDLRQKS